MSRTRIPDFGIPKSLDSTSTNDGVTTPKGLRVRQIGVCTVSTSQIGLIDPSKCSGGNTGSSKTPKNDDVAAFIDKCAKDYVAQGYASSYGEARLYCSQQVLPKGDSGSTPTPTPTILVKTREEEKALIAQ